jgi:hypothetical protein
MKKLLVLLLLTTTMFSQSKVTVKGVTLSYNKAQNIMTLVISPKSVYTDDKDMDVIVEVYKQFALKTVINEVTYPLTEPYFKQKGHIRKIGWSFIAVKPQGCVVVKLNYVYQFINIEPGDEYILNVSNLCDGKYRSNDKLKSIVIN